MKENEATIQENPSTHRKSMQRWVMYTVGAVAVFLFILTIINIVSRENATTSSDQNTGTVKFTQSEDLGRSDDELAENTNERTQAFDNSRQEYIDDSVRQFDVDSIQPGVQSNRSRSVEITADDFRKPSSFDRYADRVTEEIQNRGSVTPSSIPSAQKTVLQQALEQWQVQEEIRGLNSARVPFDFGTPADTVAVANSRNAASVENNFDQQMTELQRKRLEVKQKIERAEKLRDKLLSNTVNPEDVQRQLSTLSNDFGEAPADVAGYSKENSYDADVDGKVKMPPGTVIDAIFTQKSISDYANSVVKGMVTHDVYDVTKQFILMPKGTELILKSLNISNVNEPIQARMGFVVKWAVLPDGRKVDFSKAAFADREGVGAIKDKVNRHLMAQFLGVAAYALISSESSREGSGVFTDTSHEAEVGASLREQFAPLAAKYLNLVPTITIRNGQTFKLILEDEIFVDPWKDIYHAYY